VNKLNIFMVNVLRFKGGNDLSELVDAPAVAPTTVPKAKDKTEGTDSDEGEGCACDGCNACCESRAG